MTCGDLIIEKDSVVSIIEDCRCNLIGDKKGFPSWEEFAFVWFLV